MVFISSPSAGRAFTPGISVYPLVGLTPAEASTAYFTSRPAVDNAFAIFILSLFRHLISAAYHSAVTCRKCVFCSVVNRGTINTPVKKGAHNAVCRVLKSLGLRRRSIDLVAHKLYFNVAFPLFVLAVKLHIAHRTAAVYLPDIYAWETGWRRNIAACHIGIRIYSKYRIAQTALYCIETVCHLCSSSNSTVSAFVFTACIAQNIPLLGVCS